MNGSGRSPQAVSNNASPKGSMRRRIIVWHGKDGNRMRRFQADVASRHQKREVSQMSFVIRPLRPDEAALYRDIRLEGLRLHPEAFGSAFEQEAAESLSFFEQRLTGNTIFAGVREQEIFGTAGFMPQPGLKRAHKGHLWGMYVRAAARGTGLARQLVEAVLEHAQERVELVQLSVVAGNVPAQRLYASLGFAPYGLEERALKLNGDYLDEVLMVKRLD
jgi:ribosomal protein S18 acetylase RimI-like enzyme